MFSEERRKLIVDRVNKNIQVTVHELCDAFSASAGTIRNDLKALDQAGLLKRTHGGAISLSRISFEPLAEEKTILCLEEKQAIARQALSLVNDGDTLVLDTGTTTLELAKLLGTKKNLNVVTNDLKIALELEKHKTTQVILAGGMLRQGFHCTIGPQALGILAGLRVDKTFLAANGVSLRDGITTPNMDIAEMKRSFIKIAGEVYLLADSSKMNRTSFMRYATIHEITMLITDVYLKADIRRQLDEAGVAYLLAEVNASS